MNKALRLGGPLAVVVIVLLILAYAAIGGLRSGQEGSVEQRLRLANLAGACESSVGEDGFGTFEVSRKFVVRDEEGEISVPCKISLLSGGGLAFENVTLRTQNMAIVDNDGTDGESQVSFDESTVTGIGESGFFLALSDPSDRLDIHNSTLDYPLSFWSVVRGELPDDYMGGTIDVTNSEIRSLDPDSQGIRFVTSGSGGAGNFVDLKLKTVEWEPSLAPEVLDIIILADECLTERVEGYTRSCSSGEAGS